MNNITKLINYYYYQRSASLSFYERNDNFSCTFHSRPSDLAAIILVLLFVSRFYVYQKIELHAPCLQMYPSHDITNIVEASHYVKVSNWCKLGSGNAAKCKVTRWVKPFRCLGTYDTMHYTIYKQYTRGNPCKENDL